MPLSVRLDPIAEARLEEEAKRLGISKSQFVKDALDRTLGLKDPVKLLDEIRSGTPGGDSELLSNVRNRMTEKLREKHSD